MDDADDLFDRVRDAARRLSAGAQDDSRDVVWVDATRVLGLSRNPRGGLELFITGEPLTASDRLVAEHLRHHVWATAGGEPVRANRLVLPPGPQYDAVAAMICAELHIQGALDDVEGAFRRSEGVIALGLRRAGPSDPVLTGLAGELLLLSALCRAAPSPADVVEGWSGHRPSARDLRVRTVGIEVKTTTGSDSTHHVQGFHQVELGVTDGGAPETRLFMLSVGIVWLAEPMGSARSIPGLVDDVLETLPGSDLADDFLARVRQYGGDAALGYDHVQHQQSPRFSRSFHVAFERLYDLADERIRLLRRADVEHADDIDPDSVTFRVRLRPRVRGDKNPVTGLDNVSRAILDAAKA